MITIHDSMSDKYISHLNNEIAKILVNLLNDSMVRLDAHTQLGKKAGYAKSNDKNTKSSDLDIIIYGNREALDSIDKSLTDYEIFLQHPKGKIKQCHTRIHNYF